MADIAETKYGLDGKVTFEQADGGIKVVDLANLGGAAGAGVTNISFTRDADTVKIESDTGNDATVPAATNTLAGVMSAAQATKLAAQADTPVLSVAGKTGAVTLTGTDVGLGSVNNTSDTAKPISTATQLALNQKQNTLTAPGDVPGLTTALAGKQNTITTYTEVSGLTSALNAKQNTLTGVADVPNLQAALDAKQGRLAAGTNKLLAAPAALGGAPVQVTIGANLAFDGTTLSSTASGGGSSTYAGLTDAASVNLPTVNTPLQTALGNKADKLSSVTISATGTVDLTAALHDGRRIIVDASNVVFTSSSANWYDTSIGCVIDLKSGSYSLTPSAGLVIPSGSASSSVTAVGGSVELSAIGSVLISTSPAKSSGAGTGAVTLIAVPYPINDVASNSVAETIVFEFNLPALTATAAVEIDVRTNGTGTGTAFYQLKLGGTNGVVTTGTTVIDGKTSLSQFSRWLYGFQNAGNDTGANKQHGGALNFPIYGSTTPAGGRYLSTLATGTAGVRCSLTITKSSTTDVFNIASVLVKVIQ